MNPQRIARFLLWGGLAVLVIGLASCGVGCIGAFASAFGTNPEAEELTGGIGFGTVMLMISVAMIVVGAIIRAIAKTPNE